MSLEFSELDRDGALAEAASRLPRRSRREFLRNALLGAGVVGAGLALATDALGQGGRDEDILNFALTLEYVQASFYTEAERRGALRGIPAQVAGVVGAVERAHVEALRDALGSAAVARPFFDFQGTTEDEDAFLRTAVAFEDLAVAAYKGQLANLSAPAFRSSAASIHTVEARHAAWVRFLVGVTPAESALDEPISRARAQALVDATGFVGAPPGTEGRRSPSFTG